MQISKFAKMMVISMAVLMLLFTVGCPKLPPPDPTNPIAKVAVLPVQNMTNDLDAPNWIRVAFVNIVPSRHYELIPSDQVDVALREKLNITLAGQLDFTNPGAGAPTPQEVGTTLGVDGLFYCNLMEFQNLITGFYNKKKVKAGCKLVNAKTAEVKWEKEAERFNQEFNLNLQGAIQAIANKAIESAISKAFRANPLPNETNAVIYEMQWALPSGPVMTGAETGQESNSMMKKRR